MSDLPPIMTVPAPGWRLAFVCRSCLEREGCLVEGRIGWTLTKEMRTHLADARVRVVDTSCLGVCPKGWITALTPGSFHQGAAQPTLLRPHAMAIDLTRMLRAAAVSEGGVSERGVSESDVSESDVSERDGDVPVATDRHAATPA